MTRLLIVGDPSLLMTRVPLAAFVSASRRHPKVELVALCDAGKADADALSSRLHEGIRRTTRKLFNGGQIRLGPKLSGMRQVAKLQGLPIITPPQRDLNAPAFREELCSRWKPNAVLSLGCMQIFGPELLGVFETAINFHNGLLPHYRGLNATAWSLFNGEAETGYCFHHMTSGIDEGAVIVMGSLPVTPGLSTGKADLAKCVAASADARAVLDAIVSGLPGRPQAEGNYYSRKDRERVCRIARPGHLASAEIRRRLACFGLLELRINGEWWEVTELAERGTPSFETADARMAVRRAMFLPSPLYRVYRRFND